MKKLFFSLFFILILVLSFINAKTYTNRYKSNGSVVFSDLTDKVEIKRDRSGTPYIYGRSFKDLIMAQGYSAAQDRLFQMHMLKLYASGRISEVIGEKGFKSDLKMRTLGFARNALKHKKILNKKTIEYLDYYAKGVNRFVRDRKQEHHLEFKLAGIKPEKWRIEDTLTVLYFMGWGSAANIKTELIAANIIDKTGHEKFKEFLAGHNVNDNIITYGLTDNLKDLYKGFNLGLGSNCWVTGSKKSKGGKPILANDPHLDTRLLPGPWYPTVLVSDKIRVAGVSLAGVPGIIIGRNRWVTCGITNSYGDTQDLYIEKTNPLKNSEYLEGSYSIPYKIKRETVKIKNGNGFKTKEIIIRFTKRGPVVSDIFENLKKNVVTLRWAPFESMEKSLGLDYLFTSSTLSDIRNTLKNVTVINLNVVMADKNGNIGFQTTGRVPMRKNRKGSMPLKVVNSVDNWNGWIPFDQMPHEINSKRDWIASANHKTVNRFYPYYYSSYFSPYYRYQRVKELLSVPGKLSMDQHYNFQHDSHNVLARRLTPVFASALLLSPETQGIGKILNNWNYEDAINSTAASIFHELYNNLAYLVFQDELGPKNTTSMLNTWYFWQENFEKMIIKGKSKWFDNILTHKKENLEMLIQKAGIQTIENLTEKFGDNPKNWKWGEMHTINFSNPLFRKGFLKDVFGTGPIPYSGSVDTLQRGYYRFDKPYKTVFSASMRMVTDLSDDDKMILLLAGGVTGRTFSDHLKDQIEPFVNGEKKYIWFSDKHIKQNTINSLKLIP